MSISSLAALTVNKPNDFLRALPVSKKNILQKFPVFATDEIRFIPFSDVLYCCSKSNYTNIYTTDGTSYLSCKTLKVIEQMLPAEKFIRTHHSYLVQISAITALKKQTQEIELLNKVLVPFSRTLRSELYAVFGL